MTESERAFAPHPKPSHENHADLGAFLAAAHAALGNARFRLPELLHLLSVMKRLAPSRRTGVDLSALTQWLDRHRGIAPGRYALVASTGRFTWSVTEVPLMSAVEDKFAAIDAELDALLRE